MNEFIPAKNDNLIQDIKSVVDDAEAILRATAGQAGDGVTEMRATLTAKLADAKDRLLDMQQSVMDKTKQAAAATDEYVHENPWQSIIIAGGIGFIIGHLISSRRN